MTNAKGIFHKLQFIRPTIALNAPILFVLLLVNAQMLLGCLDSAQIPHHIFSIINLLLDSLLSALSKGTLTSLNHSQHEVQMSAIKPLLENVQ